VAFTSNYLDYFTCLRSIWNPLESTVNENTTNATRHDEPDGPPNVTLLL
jgi:hypothetical protein